MTMLRMGIEVFFLGLLLYLFVVGFIVCGQ